VDKNTLGIKLEELSTVPNWSTVMVEIDAPGLIENSPRTAYFTLRNTFTPYGVAESGVYAWVPVGLLASNFQSDENGVPFSAFPLGGAIGFRWFPWRSSAYLGFSGMANWAIYPRQSTAADGTSSPSVSLSSIALGGIVDVSNVVYVGGAYIADLRKGRSDPGLVFVVGAGPGLLQWAQARQQ
jgi:hypothetical protein